MIDRHHPAFIAACEAFNAAYIDIAVAEEIVTAILQAYEKALWQPIETAREHEGRAIVAAPGAVDIAAPYMRAEDVWTTGQAHNGGWKMVRPTHWRPLPTPPEEV